MPEPKRAKPMSICYNHSQRRFVAGNDRLDLTDSDVTFAGAATALFADPTFEPPPGANDARRDTTRL
jgi:hypothetical protein